MYIFWFKIYFIVYIFYYGCNVYLLKWIVIKDKKVFVFLDVCICNLEYIFNIYCLFLCEIKLLDCI